MQQWFDL